VEEESGILRAERQQQLEPPEKQNKQQNSITEIQKTKNNNGSIHNNWYRNNTYIQYAHIILIYIHTYLYIYIYIYIVCVRVWVPVYIYACMYVLMHMRVCASYIYTRTHALHTDIQTYIRFIHVYYKYGGGRKGRGILVQNFLRSIFIL